MGERHHHRHRVADVRGDPVNANPHPSLRRVQGRRILARASVRAGQRARWATLLLCRILGEEAAGHGSVRIHVERMMSTETYEVPQIGLIGFDLRQDHAINFMRGNEVIGRLDFNGPQMVFTGNAEESAKELFKYVAICFAERLKEEHKR